MIKVISVNKAENKPALWTSQTCTKGGGSWLEEPWLLLCCENSRRQCVCMSILVGPGHGLWAWSFEFRNKAERKLSGLHNGRIWGFLLRGQWGWMVGKKLPRRERTGKEMNWRNRQRPFCSKWADMPKITPFTLFLLPPSDSEDESSLELLL